MGTPVDAWNDPRAIWQRDIERRLGNIEAVKPDVIADRVESLSKAVARMTVAFYTLSATMIIAAVTVALAVHK